MMSEIESAYLERDQIQSTSLRDEYIQVDSVMNVLVLPSVFTLDKNLVYICVLSCSISFTRNLLLGLNTRRNFRRVFYPVRTCILCL